MESKMVQCRILPDDQLNVMLRNAFYNGQLALLVLQGILLCLWILYRTVVTWPIDDMEGRLRRMEDEVDRDRVRIWCRRRSVYY